MTPIELLKIIDNGMVEELTMYCNGSKSVINVRNIPEIMPNYEISKIWNSESGKGISVLLADNMEHDKEKNYER